MAKRKLLWVLKDMGGFGANAPIIHEAKSRGHEVVLIAEGLAAGRCKAAGLDLWFQGTVNFRDFPFTVDAVEALGGIKPNAVICGMGSPINLEKRFGFTVNALAVHPNAKVRPKLVSVSDFWGSATRGTTKTDLALVIDEADAEITRLHVGTDTPVVVVGNHAVRTEMLAIPDEVVDQRNALLAKAGTLILFAGGGGDYTTAELKFLIECLKRTPGRWGLIPRFHTKWVDVRKPDGETYGEEWQRIVSELGDRVCDIFASNGDAVAAVCHATVSGFSPLMTTALDSGRRAISLVTPETRASLKRQATIERHPLAAPGLVVEVSEARDLSPYIYGDPPAEERGRRYLKPLDAAKACDEIEKLLE